MGSTWHSWTDCGERWQMGQKLSCELRNTKHFSKSRAGEVPQSSKWHALTKHAHHRNSSRTARSLSLLSDSVRQDDYSSLYFSSINLFFFLNPLLQGVEEKSSLDLCWSCTGIQHKVNAEGKEGKTPRSHPTMFSMDNLFVCFSMGLLEPRCSPWLCHERPVRAVPCLRTPLF